MKVTSLKKDYDWENKYQGTTIESNGEIMNVIRGGKFTKCAECSDGPNEQIYRIKINKRELALCLKCYRKLSDILVFDFNYGINNIEEVKR